MTSKKTITKTEEPKLSPSEATIKALEKEGIAVDLWEADQSTLEGKSYIRLTTKEAARLIQIDTADLGKPEFIKNLLAQVNK